MSPPANLPATTAVVGLLRAAAPPPFLPGHRAHFDLRHAIAGRTFLGSAMDVASVESASGEAFHVDKVPIAVQPSVAVAAGPMARPCPGRIRHFKI